MDSMKQHRILIFLVVGLVYSIIAGPIPAMGADRTDDPLRISQSHPTDEKTYGPLAGNDPELILVHPEDCKISPACDTVEFILDIPSGLLYRIIITTMWEGEDVTGTYVPDIDVYIWEATSKVSTDAAGQTVTNTTYERIASSASASMPEVAKVADLEPTSKLKRYYLTPVLWAGNPSNYTIKIEFYEQTLQQRRKSPTPTPRRTESPPVTAASAKAPPSPKPTLSPVKVPGETGPLEDMELQALEQQVRGETKGPSRAPLILGSFGILVLAAGMFIFFFLRARRKASTIQ